MGVDACIYCKTKDGKEPELCNSLPVGASIIAADEYAPKGATHKVDQPWRYYGIGYERGPWPSIASVLMALYACENAEAVWYFGDCSDPDAPFTPEQVQKFSVHYMANGDRPYRKGAARFCAVPWSVRLYVFFGGSMLTHEQTTIRMRDAEISRFKQENEKLTAHIKKLKSGFAELIRFAAKDMNYHHKSKMLEMANELEQDV